jgi:hypothetical protein
MCCDSLKVLYEEVNSIVSDITNPDNAIQKVKGEIPLKDNLKWVREITFYIENATSPTTVTLFLERNR